jgi:potassium efflux system protein
LLAPAARTGHHKRTRASRRLGCAIGRLTPPLFAVKSGVRFEMARLLRFWFAVLVSIGFASAALAQGTAPAASPPAAPPPAAAPAATPPAAATPSAPILPPEVTNPVERLAKSVETAEKSISQLKELEGELQRLRGNVETIIYDSTSTAEALRPQLSEVRSQIERLGPPPKDGPESPTVAAERARLNALASALDGAVKTTELAWVRAKQLIDRITVMRYQIFSRNLFERRPSPLLPSVWDDVLGRMPSIFNRIKYYGGDWFQQGLRKGSSFYLAVAAPIAGGLIVSIFMHAFVTRRRRRIEGIPDFFDRIGSASLAAPAYVLGPALAVCGLYASLDSLSMFYSPWERTAEVALQCVLTYIVGSTIAHIALTPGQPQWRLLPVEDKTARHIYVFVRALLLVYILDTVLVEFGRAIYVPLVVTVLQTFLTNVTTAVLMALMLLKPWVALTGPMRVVNHIDRIKLNPGRMSPAWIKLPLWLIAGAIVATSAAGYVALGRFIAQQVVLTGTILAFAGLTYLAVRSATRRRPGDGNRLSMALESLGVDRDKQGQLIKLAEFAAVLAILMAAVPLLMLQWGFAGADIRDWATALFFGFEIGQFRVSLARILIGIVMFIALLFATRMVQHWLRERVLANSRLDAGVANSVEIAAGYVGVGLAALVSVSYAGFDVTNLAIVAGALSVGIGFGLQSIVNNFVSGLILLVERPIKVGDWIVVGDQQGNVRRISVRSTEIETFDRASLIVPNSELISGRVLNWTHRNALGRLVIKVSTDIKANPRKVIALLETAARQQEHVQHTPPPVAALEQFAPDRIEFSLGVTVTDVTQGTHVRSDLHIAILELLRANAIYATVTSEQTEVAPAAAG